MGLDIYFHRKKTKEIGYFRKVNFLVKFFEEEGIEIENLSPIKIKKSQVKDLLNRCNQVLKDHSKAEELLPTTPGFFFGSTDYDEYYFSDVERVKEFVEDTLLPQFDTLDSDESITFEIWY